VCFGNCGNVGEAEGIARRVVSSDEIFSVKPGEILVAPATQGSWSPVWPLVKAVVTDGGGSVSHACIVGREYDVPVVSNTGDATYKIKTGDRVRVESKEGLVFRIE
jgi:phosphohistidine swiveling domain-containing protein